MLNHTEELLLFQCKMTQTRRGKLKVDYFNIISSLRMLFTWGKVIFTLLADYRLMAAIVLVPVLLVAVTVVSSLKIAPFEAPKTQGAKKVQ